MPETAAVMNRNEDELHWLSVADGVTLVWWPEAESQLSPSRPAGARWGWRRASWLGTNVLRCLALIHTGGELPRTTKWFSIPLIDNGIPCKASSLVTDCEGVAEQPASAPDGDLPPGVNVL